MKVRDEDLLALVNAPGESLSVELKNWLDLSKKEAQADLAKAMLALANHGGGHVLLGFCKGPSGEIETCGAAPQSLVRYYDQDALNGIVKSYADPPFHCELRWYARKDGIRHPVVTIPGGHRTPIRALRSGPQDRHVRKDSYYIRRPGPESAPPQTSAEWTRLVQSCVTAARDDLFDVIRGALAGGVAGRQTDVSALDDWQAQCEDAFRSAVAERLASENPSRYARGHWTFAYVLHGQPRVPLATLRDALQRAKGRESGWPAWLVYDGGDPSLRPYASDAHHVECFLAGAGHDPAHSDFWRVSDGGRAFLLRGHMEDASEKLPPGTGLDRHLPVHRIGECFLHAGRLAAQLNNDAAGASARIRWTGLAGRKLGNYFDSWPEPPFGRPAVASEATIDIEFDPRAVRPGLTDLVCRALEPLYSVFDFERPEPADVERELARMLARSQ